MKIINTKITKHGSPLYYIYAKNDDYPPVIDNKIPAEKHISYAINFFMDKEYIEIVKNKDFKIADIVSFPFSNTYGVSRRFKELFENVIKAKFFKTNIDNYLLMVVDNIVDCVDFEKSNIIYYDNNRRCTYKRSESNIILSDILIPKDEFLFSIPEEPLTTFCTEQFVDMCKKNKIRNIVFSDIERIL